jgi:hypothetical protein
MSVKPEEAHYCRSSRRTRPALDLLDKCFPDPVSLVAGVDANVEDVGGVVNDTYEYVAHYLVVNHSYPGAFCPRVLDQQLDGVRGVGSNLVITDGDELALGGQLDVLETWGVLGASRTDGESAVGHSFMVAGHSDRDVPIPGNSSPGDGTVDTPTTSPTTPAERHRPWDHPYADNVTDSSERHLRFAQRSGNDLLQLPLCPPSQDRALEIAATGEILSRTTSQSIPKSRDKVAPSPSPRASHRGGQGQPTTV